MSKKKENNDFEKPILDHNQDKIHRCFHIKDERVHEIYEVISNAILDKKNDRTSLVIEFILKNSEFESNEKFYLLFSLNTIMDIVNSKKRISHDISLIGDIFKSLDKVFLDAKKRHDEENKKQ